MWELWERIVRNWKTSGVAIIAAAVIVARWYGIDITSADINTVIVGILAVVLLFAKD